MLNNTKKRFFTALFCILCLAESAFLTAKPKDSKAEDSAPAVYKKYLHPREYVFDLTDAKGKVSLKYDDASGKCYCNVDFTDLVKEEMPRKGDKVTFNYEGYASRDVQSITATVYDLTKGANIGSKVPEIFTTAVTKKQVFKKSFSLILSDDAEKSISLRLTATLPDNNKKKIDKIDLTFKRVSESTNIKKELEAEKQAIKQGLKVVRVKSNFTVVEKQIEVVTTVPAVPVEVTEEKTEPVEEKTAEVPVEEKTSEEPVEEKPAEEPVPEPVAEEPVENIIVEEEIIEEVEVLDEIVEETEAPVEETESIETPEVVEEKIEEVELEPVPQKVVIKVEPVVPVEPAPVIKVEQPKEESTYEPIVVKNKVSRHEKEYLQDYAVQDELEIVEAEDEEQEEKIQNPDKKDKSGRTALMLAAKKGDKNQIRKLLYSGADVNLKDKEGWTPLMYAARYQKDLETVDILIDAGADIKTYNKYGLSAIMFASCYNTNTQILNQLLKYYNPQDKDVMKSFVLLLSESSNSVTVQLNKAKIFIDFSIPINAFYNGKTPLMYAAQFCNSTKIIRVLLENNASTVIRSTEGKTAFDYAVSNSKLEHDNVYWTLNKK